MRRSAEVHLKKSEPGRCGEARPGSTALRGCCQAQRGMGADRRDKGLRRKLFQLTVGKLPSPGRKPFSQSVVIAARHPSIVIPAKAEIQLHVAAPKAGP